MKPDLNPAHIDRICDLKIGSSHKANTILVLLGEVPATVIDLYKGNDSPQKVQEALRAINLYPVREEVLRGSPNHIGALVVAQVKRTANLFHHAIHRSDTRLIGMYWGLPETAAVAYATKRGLLQKRSYPEDMIDNPLGFDLSEAGQHEEIRVIEERMATIRKHAPELYHELYDHLLVH
ncbi:MAG: hypothetical protein AAB681_01415 [Patescibacteria group bacterium]